MKLSKFLLISAAVLVMGITAKAQSANQQLKTQAGKLVSYGHLKTFTSTDSTLNVSDTLAITDNSAGILVVSVVASDSLGNGVTLKGTYRYHKSAGTLTLASVTNQSALTTDTGLGTATATFTATSSSNVQLKTKGKFGYTIRWRTNILQEYP